MQFGLMFFSAGSEAHDGNPYRLLIDAVRLADQNGFSSVWTPERHFHEFGALFPNPAVTSAALAMITHSLQVRAGSLISPLHDVLRIAEEWAMVDNLSCGRVAISFGSGWNIDDFVFYPERYESRHSVMYDQIDAVRRLWRGESIVRRTSVGKDVEIYIQPKPIQRDLPVWVTSSGNVTTFKSAGAIGANVLTHLIGQDLELLGEKIEVYRRARQENGFVPGDGIVTLMLHTFVGPEDAEVRAHIREPFRGYLRSAVSLEQMAAFGGGAISGGHKIDPHRIDERTMEDLLDVTFERYYSTASLLGTPEKCKSMVWALEAIGVNEIACLVDFIPNYRPVMDSLTNLAEICRYFSDESLEREATACVQDFISEWE